MKKIILGSSSKQRQKILDYTGLKYDIVTSKVEEKSSASNPGDYVCELSLNKAKSVAEQVTEDAIIITMDTVIFCNGKIYEKPKTKEEAFNNIKEFSGKLNTAYTGVTILDKYQNKTLNFCNTTDVKFREISDDEIKWYVDGEPNLFSCCGYTPLGKASIFIEKIDGDYNNLLGLSPAVIFSKLFELGYSISDFEFK